MSGSRKKKLKKEFIEAVGNPPTKSQMRKLKKMYVKR